MDKEQHFCLHCNKETSKFHNYCDFNCHIADAKAAGYKEHLPNGLPIKCISGTGMLLEHEHGDHPNYIKPVTITVHGYHYDYNTNSEKIGPEYSYQETHALIFNDGTTAITMSECSYFYWVNGKCTHSQFSFYQKYETTLDLD
jgi:hypothetical protein